jgi:hypothetical protein
LMSVHPLYPRTLKTPTMSMPRKYWRRIAGYFLLIVIQNRRVDLCIVSLQLLPFNFLPRERQFAGTLKPRSRMYLSPSSVQTKTPRAESFRAVTRLFLRLEEFANQNEAIPFGF